MTFEEFKNLEIGEYIKFNGGVWFLNIKENPTCSYLPGRQSFGFLPINKHYTDKMSISWCNGSTDSITMHRSGNNVFGCFHQFNIQKHTNKSEKEQIEEQIQTLQDKLKEIEKNDVENVIKNLITGQFIEVTYKDSFDPSPYIYRFDNIYNKNLTIYSYKLGQTWGINPETISKIIVRNDITEAYDKFQSLLRSTD